MGRAANDLGDFAYVLVPFNSNDEVMPCQFSEQESLEASRRCICFEELGDSRSFTEKVRK